LAPIRAFCASPGRQTAPQTPPVHNFFCGANALVSAVAVRAESRVENADSRAVARESQNKNVDKTRISSALLHKIETVAQILAAEKVFRAGSPRTTRRAARAVAGRGVYTQN
jgi:hypothetical protein